MKIHCLRIVFIALLLISWGNISAEEATELTDSTTTDYCDDFVEPYAKGPVDPDNPIEIIEPGFPLLPGIYTVDPGNPGLPEIDRGYAVGSIQGSLGVSSSGAAEYAVSIDYPDGGPLSPGVSLVYNSQNAGNGLAGYGVSLSGLSSITRGERSLFNNNGYAGGVTLYEGV